MQSEMWPVLMAGEYYENIWPHPSQVRPGEMVRWNSYLLSSTIMTSPAFWNLETLTGSNQFRATRLTEVAFTSQKAIFTETSVSSFPIPHGKKEGPVRLGLADGSADGLTDAELTLPIPSGEGKYSGWHINIGTYGMHTVDGLRGIDVK